MPPFLRPYLWPELHRLGWSNRIDDVGTISLMRLVKRNITGRVIAKEGDPAWQRDLFLTRTRGPCS